MDYPAPHSDPASVETVTLEDDRIVCARRWGGSGRPVVILHGLLDSSEGWRALGGQVRAPRLAFDLPGFGYSDAPPPGRRSLHAYAADLLQALDALRVDRFTLVGHSLGGAVATALAELIPDRVDSLLLLAPAGFGRIHLAEALRLPGVRRIVDGAMPLAFSSRTAVTAAFVAVVANGHLPEAEVVRRVTSRSGALRPGVRAAVDSIVTAGRDANAFHRRRVDYDGPVMAVWGSQDRLVPVAHRHGVRTAFPDALVEVWRRMGHHPLCERFDELVETIEWCHSLGAVSAEANTARRAA